MCIPPIDEPAGIHFAFLKTLADRIGVSALSMGMSADYPKAIAAGATYGYSAVWCAGDLIGLYGASYLTSLTMSGFTDSMRNNHGKAAVSLTET